MAEVVPIPSTRLDEMPEESVLGLMNAGLGKFRCAAGPAGEHRRNRLGFARHLLETWVNTKRFIAFRDASIAIPDWCQRATELDMVLRICCADSGVRIAACVAPASRYWQLEC